MDREIILVGSGGCMQELLWQIEEYNKESKTDQWRVLGYVDTSAKKGEVSAGGVQYPYLGTDEILLEQKIERNVAICVGNPDLRRKIAMMLKQNRHLHFPPIVLGDVKICPNAVIEEGCIISMQTVISTQVRLGSFTFVNIGSMLCHQTQVGSFTTLSPHVRLAGNVKVGSGCDLGMGTQVIQGIKIGDRVTTGAGSVVVSNIPSDSRVVGVPANRYI